MRARLLVIFIFSMVLSEAFGQAVFESRRSNRWNRSQTWTLVSGSDADGIPDANDDVIIRSGNRIRLNSNEACNNLTFDGGDLQFQGGNRTLNVNGDVSVTGSSSLDGFNANQVFTILGDLDVNSGASLSIPSITFVIDGTSTVNGTLTIGGFSRDRDFGDVIINNSGNLTLTGGNIYNFNGDLTNNGTFNANDFGQTFNFTSPSGAISGNNQISLFEASFNAPANYTNTGDLLIRNNLSGSGAFTNGTGGELELQNAGPFSVSTFDASATGNTVTYTGFGSPTGFTGSYYDLTLNKSSGALIFSGSPSILNDLTIQNGIFQVTTVTVNIGNNLNIQGGEFTPDNASAVVNIGGDMNLSAGQYDHNNGDVNITGDIIVFGGDFFLNGASSTVDADNVSLSNVSLTLSQGTLSSSGDFNLETGVALTANGADLNVGGTLNHNAGSANFTGGSLNASNVYVSSGNEMFINAINLDVSNAIELDGTMTFNNSSGTKSAGSILVNSFGNWNVVQPLSITISGNITNNGIFTGEPGYGTNIYTLTSSTGTLGGANPILLSDIEINSPASYTNLGDLTVSNSLVGSGTFINGSGADFTYAGNNSSGTNFTITNFDASAVNNSVIYAGTTFDQQWKTPTGANNEYFNVEVRLGTGGYQALILPSDIRVNGELTIIEGDIELGNFDLELGDAATIAGGDANNWIRLNGSGVLRQYYSSLGNTLNFPIGDVNDYSPITAFTINSATVGSNAFVEFDVIDAVHPDRNTDNTGSGGDDDGTAVTDYISRYWSLNGNDLTNPRYEVSCQYIEADVIGTESNMIGALYRQPQGETFFDWHETGVVNAVNNQVTLSNADNWGDLYAMDNNMLRLPVELISFDIETVEGEVRLTWVTASEVDNSHFIVQRSTNGFEFKDLELIEGQGTSNSPKVYQYVDLNPVQGKSYYRIKQVDFDGDKEFSELKTAKIESSQKLSINLYPNPLEAGSDINIQINGKITDANWQILDQKGTRVAEGTANEPRFTIIGASLGSGIYFLSVVTDDQRQFRKKIIVR